MRGKKIYLITFHQNIVDVNILTGLVLPRYHMLYVMIKELVRVVIPVQIGHVSNL